MQSILKETIDLISQLKSILLLMQFILFIILWKIEFSRFSFILARCLIFVLKLFIITEQVLVNVCFGQFLSFKNEGIIPLLVDRMTFYNVFSHENVILTTSNVGC